MLEDYLSNQLSSIEVQIKDAENRIKNNKATQNAAALEVKELNKKIDPSMEVFSPLKINASIKKNIGLANEEIEKTKKEIKEDKALIDELENQRISLVSMLADFREQKYKLQRYETCELPIFFENLRECIIRAKDKNISGDELMLVHEKCMQLIDNCESLLNKKH